MHLNFKLACALIRSDHIQVLGEHCSEWDYCLYLVCSKVGLGVPSRLCPIRCCFFFAGDHLSAGLDLADSSNLDEIAKASKDVARYAFRLRKLALEMQVGYSYLFPPLVYGKSLGEL